MDPLLDASHGSSHLSYARLKRMKADLHALRLIDSWRLSRPQDRDYTYFSPVHHSYSRLDYLLLSHKDLARVVNTSIDVISFSDHAPIHLTLRLGPVTRTPPSWRLNEAMLQSEEIRSEIQAKLREYFSVNEASVPNPLMVWEAHKTVVRGILISIGARLMRERTRCIDELFTQICTLECAHKASLARSTHRELLKAREELRALLFHKTKQKLAWARRTMYEYSNKPGSLLARALRGPRTKTYISHILSSSGRKMTASSDIAAEFRSFYEGLYNLDRPPPEDPNSAGGFTPQSYLATSGMPSLPTAVQEELEEPITLAELGVALADSKPRKAPGPDGFTPAYYKTFLETLSKPLISALNSITEGNSFPIDTLRAYISLIPKEGKDPLRCGSYRLIALLNTDLKLFAKILANRIIMHIPSLIHKDQTGFVPQGEPRDNTIRVINLIHAARTSQRPLLLLSTDAEKAFDRVDWSFIQATLEHIGLRSSMLSWILSLYSHPTAAVKVNGTRLSYFTIRNGTRQGCPLSPLIFILTLEPFLCRIRANSALSVTTNPPEAHKVATFADDLIFFLADPLASLPILLHSLRVYGDLSLFQINLTKSSLLNIMVGTDIVRHLCAEYQLHWATDTIPYLGVDITPDSVKSVPGEFHSSTSSSKNGSASLALPNLNMVWSM